MSDAIKKGGRPDTLRPNPKLERWIRAPHDEWTEMDLNRGRVRNRHHTAGKFFVPMLDWELYDMFRYSAEYMVHPDDLEIYLDLCDPDTLSERLAASVTPGELHVRLRYRLLGGGWRWTEQVTVGGESYGLTQGVVHVFVFDIQSQVEPEAEASAGDAICKDRNELTGLLRAEAFFPRGQHLLRDRDIAWCVLSIDIEHFKLFNEWYGWEQGNMLMAQLGAWLRRVTEDVGGLACYMGLDDFGVLMPYDGKLIDFMYTELHEMVIERGTSLGFLPAFGICMADEKSSIENLFDHAAIASAHAKENFHSRIRTYDPSMYQRTDRNYHILSDFQRGLAAHELYIMFQPQCQVSTGRVVGAESLVRWRKADGEMVPPSVFVPVLEEYGFVTDLDKYVWEEVCAWQKQWLERGKTPLPVSVNVSQIDIYTIDVAEYFEYLLMKYDLPAEVIKVEITESAYVDNGSVAETVRRLREKGFLVLMDDFGSGYSSLNMLGNLNVDIVKLDAQFLRMEGLDNHKGIRILESIVDMVTSMDLPIIVEGVETEEQVRFLTGLGCRYVQGYYFYRPMSVEDFEKLIAEPENIKTGGFHARTNEELRFVEFLDQSVYSDAMLNNILGPVAFYLWHGKDVDTVRYNQKFLEEVRLPDLSEHLLALQHEVVPEDVPTLYALLEKAMADPLNGALGTLRFTKEDGTRTQFRVHYYFLGEDERGKRFYGSVRNLTKFITLNDHMRLLSQTTPDTIVFLWKREGKWQFRAVVHGLENDIGLSRADFERELNDYSFYRRLTPDVRARLAELTVNSRGRMKNFSFPFELDIGDGRMLKLRLKADYVHDEASGVEYIVIVRKSED